jgi:hypothetical protein
MILLVKSPVFEEDNVMRLPTRQQRRQQLIEQYVHLPGWLTVQVVNVLLGCFKR